MRSRAQAVELERLGFDRSASMQAAKVRADSSAHSFTLFLSCRDNLPMPTGQSMLTWLYGHACICTLTIGCMNMDIMDTWARIHESTCTLMDVVYCKRPG